ncbi:MAG: bacterioferritin [Armatimonadetes bacterium]|nr:bacterioferritin [Armatimonadota bacterium]
MNKKVIGLLNDARSAELLAISQYMVQHYEMDDAGFGKVGDKVKEISIQEMKHAEELAERILFLGGSPTTRPQTEAKKKLSIAELLKVNIGLEEDAVKMYNESAKICAAEGDHVSKDLFEKFLVDEESHLDDFQKMLEHVEQLGDVYIATLTD